MFTEGMLVLDNVLMGVINIEPKEILVEGLRKQLCQTVAKMLHDAFIFTAQVGTVKTNVDHSKQGAMGQFGDFEVKFAQLKSSFVGLKRGIEFI